MISILWLRANDEYWWWHCLFLVGNGRLIKIFNKVWNLKQLLPLIISACQIYLLPSRRKFTKPNTIDKWTTYLGKTIQALLRTLLRKQSLKNHNICKGHSHETMCDFLVGLTGNKCLWSTVKDSCNLFHRRASDECPC